jgi:hypothetical protein
MSVMRCKMRVTEVLHVKAPTGAIESERVKLSAVTNGNAENKQWSKWTPSAEFSIIINNPGAFNCLSSGHEFYVDFTPAPPIIGG